MQPILKINEHQPFPIHDTTKSHAAESPEPAANTQPQKAPQKTNHANPPTDTYTPEEEHIPTGLYHIGHDEEGNPKVYFDNPEQKNNLPPAKQTNNLPAPQPSDKTPNTKPAKENPEDTKKAESCTGNTDKVDREIRQLKKKQQELKQQIRTEDDEQKAETLKKKLSQVESELRQKDNDAYRRRHTVFS